MLKSKDSRTPDASNKLAAADARHFEVAEELAASLIDTRTIELARPREGRSTGADVLSVCVFAIGAGRYALALRAIAGIIRTRPLGAIPGRQPAILGSLFERGEIWTVYALGALLNSGSTPVGSSGYFILLKRSGARTAIRVDSVEAISSFHLGGLFGAVDAAKAEDRALVRGAAPDGLMLLNEDAVIAAFGLTIRKHA